MVELKEKYKFSIKFTGKLEDGSNFDQSPEGEPYSFILDDPYNLPDLNDVVREMKVGDTTTLVLPPEKGFGEYDENLIVQIPRNTIPQDFDVDEGQYCVYEADPATLKKVKVLQKDDQYMYFDFNHPLAGKTLVYEIEIVGMEKIED